MLPGKRLDRVRAGGLAAAPRGRRVQVLLRGSETESHSSLPSTPLHSDQTQHIAPARWSLNVPAEAGGRGSAAAGAAAAAAAGGSPVAAASGAPAVRRERARRARRPTARRRRLSPSRTQPGGPDIVFPGPARKNWRTADHALVIARQRTADIAGIRAWFVKLRRQETASPRRARRRRGRRRPAGATPPMRARNR